MAALFFIQKQEGKHGLSKRMKWQLFWINTLVKFLVERRQKVPKNINIKVVRECKEEFNWIKNAQINNRDKLNELVDLRNYLKETYQLTEAKRKKYASLQEDITILI